MAKTAWDRMQIIHEKNRPTVRDYLPMVFENFIELHGDRFYGDDAAILGGIGTLDGQPVTVLAQVKGRDLKENQQTNFSMPHPEGYRKALRLMRQAEKFRRPVLTFIDTSGAYPGLEAEARGQGEAIARNLFEMSRLTVPVIAVVTGEGNSGGALALGVANRVLMLENAVYAILSPEGFASILWKDSGRAGEACGVMKLTAQDLRRGGIVQGVLREPEGGAHTDWQAVFRTVDAALTHELAALDKLRGPALARQRYDMFRVMGQNLAPAGREEP